MHIYYKTVHTSEFSHLTEYGLKKNYCKLALGKNVYSEEGEHATFNYDCKSPILKDLIDKTREDHKTVGNYG